MNAIRIETGIRAGGVQQAAHMFSPNRIRFAPAGTAADWLPANSTPAPGQSARPAQASWKIDFPTASHTPLEELMLGLLVITAVVGIAYGFSCLLDLVQNWASFHSGIRNLI